MDLVLNEGFCELTEFECNEVDGGNILKNAGYAIGKTAGYVLGTVYNVWNVASTLGFI